jgi:hypothetical protein
MRSERGELDVVLEEDVHHGQLAAERVAAQGRAHLVHIVGVRVNQDRHTGVLERGRTAVLVAKVGQREDHAVELAAILLQEGGEPGPLLDRFHRAVAGGRLVQGDDFVAEAFQRCDQLGARAGNEGRGEEAPVAQVKGEGGFGCGHAMVS